MNNKGYNYIIVFKSHYYDDLKIGKKNLIKIYKQSFSIFLNF